MTKKYSSLAIAVMVIGAIGLVFDVTYFSALIKLFRLGGYNTGDLAVEIIVWSLKSAAVVAVILSMLAKNVKPAAIALMILNFAQAAVFGFNFILIIRQLNDIVWNSVHTELILQYVIYILVYLVQAVVLLLMLKKAVKPLKLLIATAVIQVIYLVMIFKYTELGIFIIDPIATVLVVAGVIAEPLLNNKSK